MKLLSRLRSWLRATVGRSRMESEMDAELRFHIEAYAEDLARNGASGREAMRRARLEFGGIERVKEEGREARGLSFFETLMRDLRYGARMLRKSPGFTAVAILTLALGIGANTAIFTVVYGVLLRPLPLPEPERLLELAETYKGEIDEKSVTMKELRRLRDYAAPFEYLAGYSPVGFNVAAGNEAEHVRGMHVSADYFRVLGVRPEAGRDFSTLEDDGDGERVAVLSHGLWSRRFGGDLGRMGQKVLLNGEPSTVIGVMPAGFDAHASTFDAGSAPDVWVPLALVAKTVGSGQNIGAIARLRRSATSAQLEAQMALATKDFLKDSGQNASANWRLTFLPYQYLMGADVRPYLLLLLGAIGFVLLIACANVANLLLARGGLRGREMAVRVALGATRTRLVRQLLTESFLIAVAGGALGLALASAALGSLLALAPGNLPRVNDVHLDGWVFAFTLGISLLTGVLFGVMPAAYASKANLSDALKEGTGRASAGSGRARLRQALVAGECALSLVLLSGAGLMITTFARLMSVDPGFEPHRVLSLQFWLVGSKYNSTEETANYYRAVVQRIESLPGVEGAAVLAAGQPLERGGNNVVKIAGAKESDWHSADYREITPGFFQALGIPLKQGRAFSETDSESANRAVVINEAFARRYFPEGKVLGQHLYVGERWCEVVGVVGDVKSYLDHPAEPTTFVPASQAGYETSKIFEGWFPRNIVVRTKGDPLSLSRAVRDAVAAVDPLVPTGQMRTMDQVLGHSLALRSFMMLLLSIFGGVALALASVGIYGVISYAVAQRTREIGVRVALGARPGDVLKMVLAEGLKLVLIGLGIGVGAALMLTKLLEGMLYGVEKRDPFVFTVVSLLLMAVALGACYIPARRAMRVDPMVALRYE